MEILLSRVVVFFFGFLFSAAVLFYGFFNSWLEQQRVLQLLLIVVVLFFFLMQGRAQLPRWAVLSIIAVACIGLLSSAVSQYPIWAMKEWAKVLGSLALILVVAQLFSSCRWQVVWVALIGGVVVLLAYQFLLFYLMAFVSEEYDLSPFVLYAGFDNPRFYSQVMILFLPILTCATESSRRDGRVWLAALIFGVCVVQWALLIALGGRGSWLAVVLSSLVVWIFCSRFRPLVQRHAYTAFLGSVLYGFMFFLVPLFVGLGVGSPQGLRSGLSSREVIWGKALDMAVANPWLGVGPMHFSADWNHIAAHPHQMLLQWAAEWGFPAATVAISLVIIGMCRGLKYVRLGESATEFDAALWLSLASALILAQVDGVFVMPYTEGWLAIIAGLALSRWRVEVEVDWIGVGVLKVLSVPAIVTLLFVIICEVPHLYEAQTSFWEREKIGSPPRFWDQGWIPMVPPAE